MFVAFSCNVDAALSSPEDTFSPCLSSVSYADSVHCSALSFAVDATSSSLSFSFSTLSVRRSSKLVARSASLVLESKGLRVIYGFLHVVMNAFLVCFRFLKLTVGIRQAAQSHNARHDLIVCS